MENLEGPEGEEFQTDSSRITNLYVTVEEEEVMFANIEESALDEEEDEEVLAAAAHCIMVHYEEKESLKKKKKIQAKNWAIRARGRNQTFW